MLFPGCVYPAFSGPGFRSDVQWTPRLNTLKGNPVQLGRGGILFCPEKPGPLGQVRDRWLCLGSFVFKNHKIQARNYK